MTNPYIRIAKATKITEQLDKPLGDLRKTLEALSPTEAFSAHITTALGKIRTQFDEAIETKIEEWFSDLPLHLAETVADFTESEAGQSWFKAVEKADTACDTFLRGIFESATSELREVLIKETQVAYETARSNAAAAVVPSTTEAAEAEDVVSLASQVARRL